MIRWRLQNVVHLYALLCDGLFAAPFDIDTRCALNNDMNADRMNCAGYFVCLEGRITQAYTCTSPLLYDAATKTCRHPQNVQCGFRPELPMPQALIPQDGKAVPTYMLPNQLFFKVFVKRK